MGSKNEFSITNGDIWITDENKTWIGRTTYSEKYYDELSHYTWNVPQNEKHQYIKNGKLGYLHRYIMGQWYGEVMLKSMTDKGYVIDHINNDGLDCRITNLEFLKKSYNTAKG